jgi:hypothetical protein
MELNPRLNCRGISPAKRVRLASKLWCTLRVQSVIFVRCRLDQLWGQFERQTASECHTYPPSDSDGNQKALETLVSGLVACT